MKKLWPLAFATLAGLIILCSLGAWQIFRLAEKNQQIAQLEKRMEAEPLGLAQVIALQNNGSDIEYMTVKADGRIDAAHALAKITSYQGKPAWELIVPFISTDGIFALLDRGPSTSKETTQDGDATIYGVVRLHKKGRGLFDNDNDEAGNIWYWWDLPAMWSAANAPQDAQIARFVLQEYLPVSTSLPEHPVKVELSNNHLGYAITWFGLAGALLAVAGFFARSLALDHSKREG